MQACRNRGNSLKLKVYRVRYCSITITRDVGARHANVQILRKPVCGGAEPLFSRLASLARLSMSSTSSELWSRIFVIISSSLSSRIPS